jgi:homoserine kinase type II
MAVYTEVSDDELETFLEAYDLGELVSYKGIAEGVENSNYLMIAERGTFILTLYEKRVKAEDLPFFLGLMEHLAQRGVACPTPIHGRDGVVLRQLCGRPAALTSFLAGVWPRRILPHHCQALGGALAAMHRAGADYERRRPNALSIDGWPALYEACKARADEVQPNLSAELGKELAALMAAWPRDLPAGVIHADLFPDNVFFHGAQLSGLIDFYFACNDFLAYDLAVCLNAWCFEPDLSFNITKARLMISAYRRERPLLESEVKALPILARGSALRFLLTRLYDWLNQVDGALVKPKDPLEYVRKLRFHRGVKNAAAYGLD